MMLPLHVIDNESIMKDVVRTNTNYCLGRHDNIRGRVTSGKTSAF